MQDEAPIPFQHRFVADGTTATAMAKAYLRYLHRGPRLWIVYLLFWLLFTLILFIGYDEDDFSAGARLFGGLVYGLVPALILSGLLALMAYVHTLRNGRRRIFDGAVLESGFGDGAVVLRNPLASGRTSYAAFKEVTVDGQFVFVRFEGNPIVNVYPRELFPDEGLERLRRGGGNVR